MPVGAGSIRRVAKAAGAEVAKDTAPAKEVVPVAKQTVEKKSTEKKTMAKKTAKTANATKKTVTKNTTTKTATKAVENVREYNQVCHITEELPIYLL